MFSSLVSEDVDLVRHGSLHIHWEYRRVPAAERLLHSLYRLSRIQETVRLIERLESRVETSAQEFGAAMDLRAAAFGKAPHVPVGVLDSVAPGVFYLENINDKYHRLYARKEE